LASGADERAPELSLPIGCEIGKTCFVQSYVDIDPGPGSRDYACGSATYDGHEGVDFRLNSAAEAKSGVAVLASADGVVKGVRDGMTDAFVTPSTRDAVKSRECGNGAVLDHGRGWETQYCHMRQGSMAVRPGDRVVRGQRLGDVGYSGLAEFAHLHLSLRHNGVVVDPFSGRGLDGACAADAYAARGLWNAEALRSLPYTSGEIFAVAFTIAAPDLGGLEKDHAAVRPNRQSDQLIFFARLINIRAGDRIRIVIKGPDGFEVASTSEPLDRNKASYLAYAGKRRTSPAWPAGLFEGKAQLLRGDAVATEMQASLELGD
jgi:hypothetical protein